MNIRCDRNFEYQIYKTSPIYVEWIEPIYLQLSATNVDDDEISLNYIHVVHLWTTSLETFTSSTQRKRKIEKSSQ